MDLEEFFRALENLADEKGLWDEGIQIKVGGYDVTGIVWDGNMTIELELEGDD